MIFLQLSYTAALFAETKANFSVFAVPGPPLVNLAVRVGEYANLANQRILRESAYAKIS